MKIVFLKAAEEDLTEMFTYISDNLVNPIAAKDTLRAILRRSRVLADFPETGMNLANVSDKLSGYRALVADNYLIIYRWSDDSVSVVRVIYARSDYVRLLSATDDKAS